MHLEKDLPNCWPASPDARDRFTLVFWVLLSLLGVFALLANTPAPRRIFLLLALVAGLVEWFKQPARRQASYAFAPWVLVVLASALWSPIPAKTLADALWEVISPLAAGLLAISLARRIDRRYFWLPFGLLGLFAVPCVLGALHVHAEFWPTAPRFIVEAYAGRGVASTMGVFLSLIGFFVMVINWRTVTSARSALIFLGGWLLLAGILLGVLGHNRMYWFALFVGLLPWLGRIRNCSVKGGFVLGGVLLALLLAGVLYSSYFAKGQKVLEPDQMVVEIGSAYSTDPRWIIWQNWLALGAEQPLLGFGYGSRVLPVIGAKHITTGIPVLEDAARHHAHNVLINIVIQTGWIGLGCFLFALYGVWSLIFKRQVNSGLEKPDYWQLAALSILLAALAKSMTDDFFWGPAGILMWLFVGIFAARK